MMVTRQTLGMARRKAAFLRLSGAIFLFLSVLGAAAAEVRREQFSKFELDSKGFPTNLTLAAELGRSEARRDLTNGLVRIPAYGLPTVESACSAAILEKQYRVQMYPLAGCLVSAGLVAYAEGYSEVSRKFIEAQHGPGIWTKVRAEADNALADRSKPLGKRTEP